MQFLLSIKKGTLQVGIAPHKKSWATPPKKLSARILGYFIDRMSAARAHQTAHWNRLTKEASTKLRVGASEKMARRFSSPARSLRTVMKNGVPFFLMRQPSTSCLPLRSEEHTS